MRLLEVKTVQCAVQAVKQPVHVPKGSHELRIVSNAHARRRLVKHVDVREVARRRLVVDIARLGPRVDQLTV